LKNDFESIILVTTTKHCERKKNEGVPTGVGMPSFLL
jgi:hypothetical protein